MLKTSALALLLLGALSPVHPPEGIEPLQAKDTYVQGKTPGRMSDVIQLEYKKNEMISRAAVSPDSTTDTPRSLVPRKVPDRVKPSSANCIKATYGQGAFILASLNSNLPLILAGGRCGTKLTCWSPNPCGTMCCPSSHPYLNNCNCYCYRTHDLATSKSNCSSATQCR